MGLRVPAFPSVEFKFIKERALRIGVDDGSSEKGLERKSSEESMTLREFDEIFRRIRDKEEEEEKEKFKFEFKFSFQNHDFIADDGEENSLDFVSRKSNDMRFGAERPANSTSISNYRFLPESGARGFIQQPDFATFYVEESYVDDDPDSDKKLVLDNTEVFDEHLKKRLLNLKSFEQSDHYDDEEEVNVENSEVSELTESVGSCEWQESNSEAIGVDIYGTVVLGDKHVPDVQAFSNSERDFEGFSSLESLSGSDGYSVRDILLDYGSEDMITDREHDDPNYEENQIENSPNRTHSEHEDSNYGSADAMNGAGSSSLSVSSELNYDDGVDDANSSQESDRRLQLTNSELPALEEDEELDDLGGDRFSFFIDQNEDLDSSHQPVYLDDDSNVGDAEEDDAELRKSIDVAWLAREGADDFGDELKHIMKELNLKCEGKQEGVNLLELKRLDDLEEVEEDELESLWEHQDLIDQLKTEIKKAKDTRLPTILEESEIRTEDLMPWKADAKFLQENPLDELHKFYKGYRERMRKFDILNYQKTYAIGLLRLKNPLQSICTGKPTFASLFAKNMWPCCRRKYKNDPTEKFLREIQGDLETVYVGQLCLSWEFLWWQYEKSQELPASDSHGCQQYNQVAGEFQQFQVMIQRFLEDEPFQGARVPYYVKTRCTLRNLLQVPFVKEDSKKDKKEDAKKDNKVITSEELIYIMERSIKTIWHFIRSDKDETPVIIKGLFGNRTGLREPTDRDLMEGVKADLDKKKKKLEDLLRVGNCLVKKFKKPQEQRLSKDLFCSQVDMKLVSRVLEMPRITTEQLAWCHKKLSNITFSDRKLHREPAFLLFPC